MDDMKILKLLAILAALTAPCDAQVLFGMVKSAAPAYVGPGDSQAFNQWGSCSYAFSTADAVSGSAACDLVDTATGLVADTVHVTSAGTVNYTTAQSAGHACATACSVAKVYDKTGNTTGWTQATLANMPQIAFAAVHSLPVINCTGSSAMAATVVAQAQPYTFEALAERTGNFSANQNILGNATGDGFNSQFGFEGANTVGMYNGAVLSQTAADSAPHVLQMTANAASSTIDVDGVTQTTGNSASNNIGSGALNFCQFNSGVNFVTGYIGEFGIYPTTYNSAVQSNARSRWGL
jgi:hypothetical protein